MLSMIDFFHQRYTPAEGYIFVPTHLSSRVAEPS